MSRLCRLRNASHGDDGQWAYSEIVGLREQVEKLTKERDTEIARNRPLQSLIKSTEETKSFLLKKSEENKEAVKQLDSERQANAVLTEELAALAEQNEKFRKLLPYCNTGHYGYSIQQMYFEAAQLPNLATPVLNRIRAEGMREAAKFVETQRNDIPACGFEFAAALRARAAELEKTNG